MATYYCRKTGNDGNAGTSPATARLTVNAGINLFAAGGTDKLYVGPGTYIENAGVDVSGLGVGTEHEIIADPFGEFTGDTPGVVRVTGSSDNATRNFSAAMTFNASHVKIKGFVIDGAADGVENAVLKLAPTATRTNVTLEDCLLDPWGGPSTLFQNAAFDYSMTFRRCHVRPFVNGKHFEQGGGNTLTLVLESCFLEGARGSDTGASHFTVSGVGTMALTLRQCFIGSPRYRVFYRQAGTFTVDMRNCVVALDNAEVNDGASLTVNSNLYEGNTPPSLGTGETAGWSGQFLLWSLLRGFSQYSAIRTNGGVTIASQLDIFNRTIPQGSGPSLGPAQARDYPTRDTGTFGSATPAMASQVARRLLHIFDVIVKGGQVNTFSVKMRYNASYTVSPKPQMIVKANPAIGLTTDTTVTADATALGAFATFGLTVSPTADGVVEVWLETYSTEAGAQAWFDDLILPQFA